VDGDVNQYTKSVKAELYDLSDSPPCSIHEYADVVGRRGGRASSPA
jgi:hypothetical protein